jgi:hypothetical protein
MRVLKDIKTPAHFYPAGADITAEQLDGPLTAADWQRLGHLEAEPAPAGPAPEPEAAPVGSRAAKTSAAPRESD